MIWEIMFFFLVISFVYSSVGFGGGSSYLALLAVYGLPFQELRLIALLCNIIVVTGGVVVYVRNKQLNWKKTIPLVLVSVPMAFLGAILKISQSTFFVILGISLIVASILLWIEKARKNNFRNSEDQSVLKDAGIGAGIGFLSGLVGIGGGIFLSPILNLMRWDSAKKIAATASLFILLNSISGILGQVKTINSDIDYQRLILLCLAVFIGGQIGSRVSIKWSPVIIKRITAVLGFIAGVNVLIKYVPQLF
jgi:uncharacterized membrane protein YfcA